MLKITTAALVAYPLAITLLTGTGSALANDVALTQIEQLGEKIFFDETLSINQNQACASCHDPDVGWTSPNSEINAHGAVFQGSVDGEFGNRKPPSSAYATQSPNFHADFGNRLLGDDKEELTNDPRFVGGNFVDGRATGWKLGNPAADQAQAPFLNPVEQGLPDAACVVYRVCKGEYARLFDKVWTPNACGITWATDIEDQCKDIDGVVALSPQDRKKVDNAYDRVTLSIAAFEGSKASNAFTSRLDAIRASRGAIPFTPEEKMGHDLFELHCISCHAGARGPGDALPLLTDYSFWNLGVPRNPENPHSMNNPKWKDPGLGGFLKSVKGFTRYAKANDGKHKVTTIRNVGLGSCEAEDAEGCIVKAYMHNGYFKSLKSVMHFYNTRDTLASCESIGFDNATEDVALANNCWPEPEIAKNVETATMGDLGLTEEEEDAVVTFMLIMSDGYIEK